MAGTSSSRRGRDRDSKRDLVRYDDEYDRGRSSRPPAQSRSSSYGGSKRRYYDDDPDDSDYYSDYDDRTERGTSRYPPRASDARSRRHRSETRDDKSRRGGKSRGSSTSRHTTAEEDSAKKRNQMIKAALMAGAVEAFRQRKNSGEWMGAKGMRVATAAISAGMIDAAVDKDPNRKGKRHILQSMVGGLLVDKVANGGRR